MTFPTFAEITNCFFLQVSNFNLYLLGKKLGLHQCLISEKFEPAENWLPPGYIVEEQQPIEGTGCIIFIFSLASYITGDDLAGLSQNTQYRNVVYVRPTVK